MISFRSNRFLTTNFLAAWHLLTGIKEQYAIQDKTGSGRFGCFGRFNSRTNEWADLANSPEEGEKTVWYVLCYSTYFHSFHSCPFMQLITFLNEFVMSIHEQQFRRTSFPLGDDSTDDISMSDLFHKMSIWSEANYMMGAGTKGDSDSNTTNGLVDDHAYSVVQCLHHVAGTKVNMVQVRNPWGKGEIEDGEFADNGPGWQKYPQIKDLLKPTASDDGLFWLTESEFFQYFERVFLCAADMKAFCQK